MKKLLLILFIPFLGNAMPANTNTRQSPTITLEATVQSILDLELPTRLESLTKKSTLAEKIQDLFELSIPKKVEHLTKDKVPNEVGNYKLFLQKRHKPIAFGIKALLIILGINFTSFHELSGIAVIGVLITNSLIDILSECLLNPWNINPTNSDAKLEYIGMLFRYMKENNLLTNDFSRFFLAYPYSFITLFSVIQHHQFFYLFTGLFDKSLDETIEKMNDIVRHTLITRQTNSPPVNFVPDQYNPDTNDNDE